MSGVIDIAKGELGVPYVWGGATPSGFDCSGLIQWVYGQAGLTIPRTSREQKKAGVQIPLSQAQPGDLLLYTYYGSADNPPPANHIGLYVSPGQMIDAPRPGKNVEYDPIDMSALDSVVHITGSTGKGAGTEQNQILQQTRDVATVSAGYFPGGDWDPLNWPGDLLSSTGGIFSDALNGVGSEMSSIASSVVNSLLTAIGPIILTGLTVTFAGVLVLMGLWRLTEGPRNTATEAAGSAAKLAAVAA